MNMKMIRTLIAAVAILLPALCQAQDWAGFNRYAEQNTQVTTTPNVVFMGDSITEGWTKEDPAFFIENNFLGRGISGQTTSQMLVRFRKDVIDFSPRYVVILAGTNDVARNNGDISLENVLGNIISMCELAKVHKIRPILCAVLPATGFWWRPEVKPADDLIRLNSMIKEYARSAKVPFVDFHTPLKDEYNGLPEVHAADGVHPNLQCYKIMEEIILDYIK
jgi:lysophospholipase L1-like esterase